MLITIIYNISSVFAALCFIGSIQFKKKKNILLIQSFSAFFYFITYLIVGAISGCIIQLICQIKNLFFYHYEKKNQNSPLILLIIFLLSLIIVSIFTYNGFYTLLPLIINILYFISSYFKNPKYIRIIVLICGFIWIFYNITVGAYIIIIGNIFEILSAAISLFRYRKDKLIS